MSELPTNRPRRSLKSRFRELNLFDVALVTQVMPARETIEMYQASGVPWVLVTGWDQRSKT